MEASWGELAAYVEDGSGTVRLTRGFRGARDRETEQELEREIRLSSDLQLKEIETDE
jgi:hypothetical protein